MGKIKECFVKHRQMRIARYALRRAEEKITCYPEAYYLHSNEDEDISACRAEFKKVYSSRRSQNVIDENGCTSTCHLFNSEVCVNNKCPMHALNLDYFVCKEKYEAARAAYLNLVKEILFGHEK